MKRGGGGLEGRSLQSVSSTHTRTHTRGPEVRDHFADVGGVSRRSR